MPLCSVVCQPKLAGTSPAHLTPHPYPTMPNPPLVNRQNAVSGGCDAESDPPSGLLLTQAGVIVLKLVGLGPQRQWLRKKVTQSQETQGDGATRSKQHNEESTLPSYKPYTKASLGPSISAPGVAITARPTCLTSPPPTRIGLMQSSHLCKYKPVERESLGLTDVPDLLPKHQPPPHPADTAAHARECT
uniref:Uncharacterized protein n=1 Tax=Knipowitschia caucasica TaxID=637954 RepID=A0AAV2MKJ5_KNICA